MTFILQVLALFERVEHEEALEWHVTDDGVTFAVRCNDVFWWACADTEDITPENLAILVQSFDDVAAVDDTETYWGVLLFCARVRGLRPQGCCYPKLATLWPLFDAAGPQRVIDFGNPYQHPADGGAYAYVDTPPATEL